MKHINPQGTRSSFLLGIVLFCVSALCAFAQSGDSLPTTTDAATATTTLAQTPAALFAQANANYAANDITAAAEQFAQLANEAPSLAVYYNLGNAYFRLGQYGRAIAAYQKALALNPAQPDVLANLQSAQEAARITPLPATRWQHYARKLSPNAWAVLLAVSFWCALALWLVPAQFRRQYGIWRPSLLALAIAVFLLSAIGLYPWRQMSRSGTVLEADTPLLLAPVASSPVQSYAQAGQNAQWLGSHGKFDRIRLPDGSEGWVTNSLFSTTWNLSR